ncbi:P-loop containing nucleoside triphosphate hydrolase protein [Marasmius fiardii PR-910]|nr:P-loop containing nucleoside triphosphate hydrolase protein [Marasmius fiardii PR-910]
MDRAARLEKQFNLITTGKQPLTSLNYTTFIDGLLAQPDVPTCVNRLISGKAGLSSLQACMRFDLSPTFFNGRAASLLQYFQHSEVAGINGGTYLHQVIHAIVEPPIFWLSLSQAFREGNLQQSGQEGLAWLLLQITSMSILNAIQLSCTTVEGDMMDKLKTSPYPSVRDLVGRVSSILAGLDAVVSAKNVLSAGGRHDNDFADFRKIEILPTAAEIRSTERPFLLTKSCLDDPEIEEEKRLGVYLANEFRLLREDMLYEMKEELSIASGAKKGKRRSLIIDDLRFHGLHFGPDSRRSNWAVELKCTQDLLKENKIAERKKFLTSNHSRPFRHQSWSCLIIDGEITAFPTLNRDEDLLAKKPPVLVLFIDGHSTERTLTKLKDAKNIRLIVLDTAVFSYEPILKALQGTLELSLHQEFLHWREGDNLRTPLHMPTAIVNLLRANPTGDLQPLLKTLKSIKLDASQHTSLVAALTQKVSLIQGPPGTGKSFIGALLAKTLHDHTDQKILVVCYTNHALDQFLEDLMDIGIPQDSIVRLGGKSTSRTAPLSLNTLAKNSNFRLDRYNWARIDALKSDAEEHIKTLGVAFSDYMDSSVALQTILDYLEFEEPEIYYSFCVPRGEDGMTQVGRNGKHIPETYLFDRWRRGQNSGIYTHLSTNSLWTKPQPERTMLLVRWTAEINKEYLTKFTSVASQYNTSLKQLSYIFSEKDDSIIAGKRIIGCTTTAAAKYNDQIRRASPQVLLVEEAGEILESHILTAMNERTDQLILIGDHQQLRPKANNYALTVEKGEGFNLNMSLFERLVLKGYPHETLHQQHRMRPEISSLVRELTYPHLIDASDTRNRPSLRGFEDVVIFLDHNHPEKDLSDVAERRDMNATSSKQNMFEVDMVLKTLKYLAQQGYGTDKVTILTPYLGQLQQLRKALMNDNDPVLNDLDSYDLVQAGLMTPANAQVGKKSVRLATIDNYQGEESEVIIASLTRSNSDHNIGFMSSPERLNVLLSRARNALILIGNSDTFTKSRKGGELWTRLLEMLRAADHVYDGLPVKCERHPDRKAILKSPADFENEVPDGGCKEPCGTRLSCGIHDCPSRCHQLADHSQMKCMVIIKTNCHQGHPQSYKCYQKVPLSCRKCDAEAKAAKKKQEEAFAQQQKRDAELLEHAKEMASIDEQIARENQRAEDDRSRQERQNALEQRKEDLARLRARNEKTAEKPSPQTVPPPSDSTSTPLNQINKIQPFLVALPTTRTSPSPGPYAPVVTPQALKSSGPSPSEAEWARQKQLEGAHNPDIDSLMELTGLEEVKAQVLKIKAKIDLSKRQGVDVKDGRFNVVMLGNPGTGKTTVARLYAQFLFSVDALPGSHFIETTGSNISDSGVAAMKKHIEDVLKAGGGAIFVDEAYQLVSGTSLSGKEVLNYMLAEMENNVGKLVFILAGYRKEMEKFFEHNPGIPSRVPYQLRFEDYTDDELLLMLRKLIVKRYNGQMKVEGDIDGLYGRIAVRRLGRGRGKEGFGNARALQNMFAKITERQAARINKERAAGMKPDDFLLLSQDLIGPKPSDVLKDNESWTKLQAMIGLKTVKETVRVFMDLITTNYQRELQEKEVLQVSLNRIFTGSPGTGKTTVAKLFGQLLTELSLLSNVIIKNPSDFVGAHLGESEQKTKAILASTVGKVLVIDEAYMLYGGDGSRDIYRTAVIDTLVAEIQSVPGEDRCVLLLGYKDQMMAMFQNVNSGLSRRFDIENPFHFEDFSQSELEEVLKLKLRQQDLSVTDAAKTVALDVLDRGRNQPNFGNGGEVENMITQAKIRYQKRQAQLPLAERSLDIVFEPEDFDPDHDRQNHATTNLKKLFEDVVGCEDIVKKLGDYQKVAAQMKVRKREIRGVIPMNFVFKGPPGTGKTTTARKMGQVFYDMGLLSSAEVHECSVSDIVGQYVGQTGPLVRKMFDKALGRVLFIDEAYRLGDGHFAQEAVDEIVSLMTQDRYMSKVVIILAGYDDDMNQLMKVNTGLSSRFTEEIVFHNMSPSHCLQVLDKQLREQEVVVNEISDESSEANVEMRDIIEKLSEIPSWGNIRDIITLSKQMVQLALVSNEPGASPLSLTADEVLSCFRAMLSERVARHTSSSVSSNRRTRSSFANHPSPVQSPPFLQPPVVKTSTKTNTAPPSTQEKKRPSSPVRKPKPQSVQVEDVDDERDENVSDAVWNQLKRDKEAQLKKQREAEKAARDLERAKKEEEKAKKLAEKLAQEQARAAEAREKTRIQELKAKAEAARLKEMKAKAERERLEAIRKEQERQQREEARVQQRLRQMGVCVAGYEWIKESGGYRCAGGSHFISDSQLGV